MILGLDPLYWILITPAILLAFYAQVKVQTAFSKYSRVPVSSGITGAEAAYHMLRSAGLSSEVRVEPARGFLSDHYDPRQKVIRLSHDVYNGRSVAAVGVACHEAGHALQHAQNYVPLGIRNAIVPIAGFGSWAAWPMIFIGLIFNLYHLAVLGVIVFSALVLFQVINLPVEFNASARAKALVTNLGMITSEAEYDGMSSVLNAAALTYVAATAQALVQLLYFVLRLGLLNGNDN